MKSRDFLCVSEQFMDSKLPPLFPYSSTQLEQPPAPWTVILPGAPPQVIAPWNPPTLSTQAEGRGALPLEHSPTQTRNTPGEGAAQVPVVAPCELTRDLTTGDTALWLIRVL